MARPTVLFRVDAGRRPGLSYGHLYRCLALAEEIADRARPLFLLGGDPEAAGLVARQGVDFRFAPAFGGDAMAAEGPLAVVIDLPAIPAGMTADLARRGLRVLVHDDNGRAPDPDAILIDGNPCAEPADGPRCFRGGRYCILASAFDPLPPTPRPETLESILITFGGSDPGGLTERVVAALAASRLPAVVSVVLGPGFRGRAELERAIAASGAGFRLLNAPDDLAGLMRASDLAIAAGGRTAFELAATGTPAILVPTIAHEERITRALAAAGTAIDLGPWTEESPAALLQAIARLAANPGERLDLAAKGPALVDGKGRHRVAAIVLGEPAED